MLKEKATFGGGCFWGIEEAFRELNGFLKTSAGYTGGKIENPTYKDICTGITGHAEVVQIEFDPNKISYSMLLQIFWEIHDPTTLNRQGPDRGTQYRSVVFYHSENQKELFLASKDFFTNKKIFSDPIVTELSPIGVYYIAEDYHQQYLLNTEQPSCHRRKTLPVWFD